MLPHGGALGAQGAVDDEDEEHREEVFEVGDGAEHEHRHDDGAEQQHPSAGAPWRRGETDERGDAGERAGARPDVEAARGLLRPRPPGEQAQQAQQQRAGEHAEQLPDPEVGESDAAPAQVLECAEGAETQEGRDVDEGWTTKNVPVIGVHQRPSSRAGSPYAHVYMPALSTNGSHSPRGGGCR